jgi:uncharacterized protein (TIGR03437 family)
MPWRWDRSPATLQSRAWDEAGNVQPTRAQFVAQRGELKKVPPAAAVLNQEGSVNDAGSAASRGSVVSFFATGLGQSTPASLTGTRAPGAGAQNASVTLKMANVPVQVLYAGPAPGLVGVTQVNARVPQDVPVSGVVDRVSVTVMVNGAESRQGVTFWVK